MESPSSDYCPEWECRYEAECIEKNYKCFPQYTLSDGSVRQCTCMVRHYEDCSDCRWYCGTCCCTWK